MLGILLPSFILMLLLSHLYFQYGELPIFSDFFKGILPAVSAIILSVAITMSKKHLQDYRQIIMCIASGVILLLVREVYITLSIMIGGAVTGILIYRKQFEPNISQNLDSKKIDEKLIVLLLSALLLIGVLPGILPIVFSGNNNEWFVLQRDISYTFQV